MTVNNLPACEGELTLTASRTTQIAANLSITFTSIPILNNKLMRLFGFLTVTELGDGLRVITGRNEEKLKKGMNFPQRGLSENMRFKVSQGLSEEERETERED